MIETTETLAWALLVFATTVWPDGRETTAHSAPQFYETHDICQREGERLFSQIDVAENTRLRFACVPRQMLREDLALNPPSAAQ